MAKICLNTVFATFCFIFAMNLLCDSCQSVFGSFQEILQTHQREGRVPSNSTMRFPTRTVFTKMECLDMCLRSPRCDGFEMRQKASDIKSYGWVCKIYRLSNSTETKRELASSEVHHWIHFNVSSRKLQKVSFSSCLLNFSF